jgi:hypothetical protein
MDGARVKPTESQGPCAQVFAANTNSMARESVAIETFLNVDCRLSINAFVIVNKS